MSDQPLVSVIVPAYNAVKYIPETLASIFEQDYPNIEIIVVNDGSTDDTLRLLQSYQDRIVLIDQPNAGAPGARNTGIRAARGEFIGFCDSDDVWAPHKVSEQITYLMQNPDVGMVYCDLSFWHPDAEGKYVVPADFKERKESQVIDPGASGWLYHLMLLDCMCLTSSVMFRQEIVAKVGFFALDLWNGDDYDYWIRTSRITEIHKLKSQLVLYRILQMSVSRTPTRINYEYEVVRRAIERWGTVGPNGEQNSTKEMRERFARTWFYFGLIHLKLGDPALAVQSFWDCIQQRPLRFRPWALMALGLYKQLANKAFPKHNVA